jgi:thymidylate synthase (FAD)
MSKITASYIDHMGDDLSVARAARVSFAKDSELNRFGFEEGVATEADTRLINYLAKHNHWTPFAHTAITFRVSAPVPIRTQCFKHKQGFVENEESRRYISGTPELYIPDEFRNAPTGGAKQGSEGVHLDSGFWIEQYREICKDAIFIYQRLVKSGVCPEQARFILPQGCIVNWYWTGSLAAYARFYTQRTDPHAQKEIRDLAEIIGAKIGELFPVSWAALTKET